MPASVPIRHHFIPQFILRNFVSEQGYFSYYEKETGKVLIKQPKDVFFTTNLYKNDSLDDPMEIENLLAKYEGEIAPIIKERFLFQREFDLSKEEFESLLLFFAIMSFRSKRVSDAFGINASKESKEFYSNFQNNGDIHSFWSKNLRRLVMHRSLQQVLEDPEIDEPIKVFMIRDTLGMTGFGLFPVIVERRGQFDFLITDTYPTLMTGDGPNGIKIPLYSFFPISPSRMLIFISAEIDKYSYVLKPFKNDITRIPFITKEGKMHLTVKKFYEKEVRIINAMALENLYCGAVLKDPQHILFETDWRRIIS